MDTPSALYPLAVIAIEPETDKLVVEVGPILLPPNATPKIIGELYKALKTAYIKRGMLDENDVEQFELDLIQRIEEELTTDDT
jgi:hypothetical protein